MNDNNVRQMPQQNVKQPMRTMSPEEEKQAIENYLHANIQNATFPTDQLTAPRFQGLFSRVREFMQSELRREWDYKLCSEDSTECCNGKGKCEDASLGAN